MPFKNFFSKPPNLSEPKIKVIKKEAVNKKKIAEPASTKKLLSDEFCRANRQCANYN